MKNTKGDNADEENFAKASPPLQRTRSVQVAIDGKPKIASQYLRHLRKRLDISEAFLKNAKQDVKSMKYLLQKQEDDLAGRSSFDSMAQTGKGIQDQMKGVNDKLNELQIRLRNLKDRNRTNLAETISEYGDEMERATIEEVNVKRREKEHIIVR